MPLIRITKTDPDSPANQILDMALDFVEYDNVAYNFTWTGRNSLLPLNAIAMAVNPNSRQAMLRSVWIAADAATSSFWDIGDQCSILSSRHGARGTASPITQTIIRLPIASPYDRIAIVVGAKQADKVYSFDIMINAIDEGDWSFPETPVA